MCVEGENARLVVLYLRTNLFLQTACLLRVWTLFVDQKDVEKPPLPTGSCILAMNLVTILIFSLSRPIRVSNKSTKKLVSGMRNLSLAYVLHTPLHKPLHYGDDPPSALIVLHGLFGSKKNNSTICRLASWWVAHYVVSCSPMWIARLLAQDLQRPVYAVVWNSSLHATKDWKGWESFRTCVITATLPMIWLTPIMPWPPMSKNSWVIMV